MRSFVVGCFAAIMIAIVGALALNAIQQPADTAFATTGARN